MKKLSKRALEAKINKACCQACNYLPINIRDLHKVSTKCQELIAAGVSDETLAADLRAFAEATTCQDASF
jgi:hypothetical protein